MTNIFEVSVKPKEIEIGWEELTDPALNGGETPDFYSLEWSSDQATWTAVNPTGTKVLSYKHTVAAPFSANSKQYYRVRAKNTFGYGPSTSYSQILEVTADNLPQGMTNLAVDSVTPYEIAISWPELSDPVLNGRDLPIFYSVEYKESTSATWTVLNPGGAYTLNFTHKLEN
jgi:hypothetical protein